MDAYPLLIIAAVCLALLIGWAARDLKQRVADLNKRIATLETAAQNSRLPYKTTDDALDIIANVNTEIERKEIEIAHLNTIKIKLHRMLDSNKKK